MNNEHVDRLEEALRSVVEAAIAKELAPAQFEHAILWWEPYSDRGSTGRTELRKATDYRSVGQMLYADPAMKQLRIVADDIRKIKWPEFLLDPTAENLCECYFSTTGSVAIDEAGLRRVAQKYVTEVQAEDSAYVTVFQVEHFSAVEAFQLDDNIEFRRITDADIEHFGFEPLPVRQSPRLNKRDWICTVCQSYRADDISASHRSRDIWDVLIGSLGLSSEGNAWFSLLCEGPKSPFLSSRHYGSRHRMHSSPSGNEITLDQEGISRYKNTFARIKAICDQNTKNLVPSFRRFRAAAGREVMDDKLTDLVIALESLLVPDGRKGEIRYKFGMRGGALLPERLGGPRERRKLMQRLYDARSEVVHGSKGSARSEVTWLINRATDSFRTIFEQLSQSPTSVEKTIVTLDDAMVKGGGVCLNSTEATSDGH